MKRLTRSSKKWTTPKRKLDGKTIRHHDYDIMSDGCHCYYLCRKKIHTTERCEFILRRDYVKTTCDLNHTCFLLSDGDITQFGSRQKYQMQIIQKIYLMPT